MGMFDNIEEASVQGSFRYFSPGRYWAKLIAFKPTTPRNNGPKGAAFEFEIVRTLGDKGDEIGATVSDVISNKGGAADYFLSDCKKRFAVLLGCAHQDITKELANKFAEDDSALRDRVVDIEVYKKDEESDYTQRVFHKLITADELEAAGISI